MSAARHVVEDYLRRYPGAEETASTEGQFSAELALLRRILHTADLAMEDEGVGEEVRVRVLRTVVYGAADPEAGAHRRREQVQMMRVMEGASVFPSRLLDVDGQPARWH